MVMDEARLGEMMRAHAWKEGHRPRMPEASTAANFSAASGDRRRNVLEQQIIDVLQAKGKPTLIEHVASHFPYEPKYAIENAMRRLKTAGKVRSTTDITVARNRVLWEAV
jgi:hypothetical protein